MTERELAQLSKLNTKRENKLYMTERECQEFVELIIKMQTEEIERLRNDLIRATTTLVHAGFKDTGEYLWQAAKATPSVPQWIPVSEPPKEAGRYWCYVEYQTCLGLSHYQWNCSWDGKEWWCGDGLIGEVTHWMPLPAAPEQPE